MQVDIPSGPFVITPARVNNPVVGMTPLLRARQNSDQPLAQGKPVQLVPGNYPEYTRLWELTTDGTLALSYMHSELYAIEEAKRVYLGSDSEEWFSVTYDTPYGPRQTIQSKKTGFGWFLPNTDEGTQPELRPIPRTNSPPPGYLFNFIPVDVE
ncbi:hypothetical protein SCLCIDRAFT_27582 [Scleroderma citrinum Foug A]|uniref:Carbohydrate-binding module family 13 protein n=1 Tax=Scleroderma citrinum Foug A TaxID=1036808 RepID=A0A0C3DSM1_9AGAM|nr:hypothetical protein SCLCIDRAFT_27582 [Scleroderma citrinum Foug A]